MCSDLQRDKSQREKHLESLLAELTQTRDKLQAELDDVISEKHSIWQQLTEENRHLQLSLDGVNGELTESKQSLKLSEEDKASLEARLAEVTGRLSELSAAHASLESSLQSTQRIFRKAYCR